MLPNQVLVRIQLGQLSYEWSVMNKRATLKSNSWYDGANEALKPAVGTEGRVISKYKTTAGLKVVIFKTDDNQYIVPENAVRF